MYGRWGSSCTLNSPDSTRRAASSASARAAASASALASSLWRPDGGGNSMPWSRAMEVRNSPTWGTVFLRSTYTGTLLSSATRTNWLPRR